MTEEQLIQGCVQGNRAAQKQLYDTCSARMYGLCCRYIKIQADAEDVLVTAFATIFKRIDQYRGEGSFEGWMKRIVINEALTFLRKNKKLSMTTSMEEIPVDVTGMTPPDSLEQEDLMQMIESLPDGYRSVFNLYAIDGFSHREIAEKLKISENTSKSQLSRARGFLQKLLAQTELSPKTYRHDIAS